ncbi:MAG: GDP-mannose 4,6-dehydratase [Chthoniobacterales bacterium]
MSLVGEVDALIGDPAKAKRLLDWEPDVRFRELVEFMGDADMKLPAKPNVQKHFG